MAWKYFQFNIIRKIICWWKLGGEISNIHALRSKGVFVCEYLCVSQWMNVRSIVSTVGQNAWSGSRKRSCLQTLVAVWGCFEAFLCHTFWNSVDVRLTRTNPLCTLSYTSNEGGIFGNFATCVVRSWGLSGDVAPCLVSGPTKLIQCMNEIVCSWISACAQQGTRWHIGMRAFLHDPRGFPDTRRQQPWGCEAESCWLIPNLSPYRNFQNLSIEWEASGTEADRGREEKSYWLVLR